MPSRYDRFLVWFSATRLGTWVVKYYASRLDPMIFRATNGRFTSTGPPSMPMLTLTAKGRHSGQPRSVQLVCIEHGGDWLIVASAMGQERHPAWRYNIEADPDVELQMKGERFRARATLLSDAEKDEVWDAVKDTIPQMNVYETRTDRNIRVFRLCRIRG